MNLNDRTLEKLRNIINEESEYRSGSKLVDFFNNLGYSDAYGQGFPSRKDYTDERLKAVNGTPAIQQCIKQVFNPINFIERFSDLDVLIRTFNEYLAFDDCRIVRNNTEIILEQNNKMIETDTNIIGNFTIFISHCASDKEIAHKIKGAWKMFGIECFVAHDDIEPSTEWITEIKKMLDTCDCLIALITEDYNKRPWTNQEIGYVMGRGVPHFTIKLNDVPPAALAGMKQAMKYKDEEIDNTYDNCVKGVDINENMLGFIISKLMEVNNVNNKLANVLVEQFCKESTFCVADKIMSMIELIPKDMMISEDMKVKLKGTESKFSGATRNKLPDRIRRLLNTSTQKVD